MANPITVGARYGKLLILELLPMHVEPSGHRRSYYRVRCACGAEYPIVGMQIHRMKEPQCIRCAGHSRRLISVGDRFDKLTVTGFTTGRRVMAICHCDCGNTIEVRPFSLPRNTTNHCGCSPQGHWNGTGQLSMSYYTRTKRGAEKRSLPFTVSLAYLWDTYVKQGQLCALTMLPLFMSSRTCDIPKNTASLDRIDSTKGYIEGNVQWVHKDANKMKMDFSMERFVELCALVTASHPLSPHRAH